MLSARENRQFIFPTLRSFLPRRIVEENSRCNFQYNSVDNSAVIGRLVLPASGRGLGGGGCGSGGGGDRGLGRGRRGLWVGRRGLWVGDERAVGGGGGGCGPARRKVRVGETGLEAPSERHRLIAQFRTVAARVKRGEEQGV